LIHTQSWGGVPSPTSPTAGGEVREWNPAPQDKGDPNI